MYPGKGTVVLIRPAQTFYERINLQLPEDEVGRLASTFDEMIGRLDAAFRRQRQFTADASHELRTPLTVMKGQVEVALQIDRSGVEYRDVLESVNSEVDRLIGLAGSLLTLARADAGEIPLSLEPVDLGEAVSGTVEHMKPAAAEKDIGIEVTAGPETTVQVDETLFLQLMLNLLDNAVKYTPQGGRISVGWDGSAQVELWIKDTGIGISEEHIPHIMDRFYRADDSRGRSEGGVGLGLAIGRWIARKPMAAHCASKALPTRARRSRWPYRSPDSPKNSPQIHRAFILRSSTRRRLRLAQITEGGLNDERNYTEAMDSCALGHGRDRGDWWACHGGGFSR